MSKLIVTARGVRFCWGAHDDGRIGPENAIEGSRGLILAIAKLLQMQVPEQGWTMKLDLKFFGVAMDTVTLRFIGIGSLLLSVAACSQPRKPVEEIDWGQPPPRSTRQPPRAEEQPEPPADEGGQTAGSTTAEAGAGADPAGSSGGSTGSDGTASDADAASPSRNPPDATETSRDGPAAAGSEPTSPSEPAGPMPALPGRATLKPQLSAADAATSARQLLAQAQQLMREDKPATAAEKALEAYDQVLPHAEGDPQCKKLSQQLESVLDAAGRRRGPADAVPTRFE